MRDWTKEPGFEHLQQLAKKIEKIAAASNAALLKGAQIEPGQALDVVSEVQATMLRLDDHGKRRFREALEEKRVRTYAQESLIMTCVLASAVALTEFKKQPRKLSLGLLDKPLAILKDRSTTGLGLSAFAMATFYAVMGRGVARRVKDRGRRKTIKT